MGVNRARKNIGYGLSNALQNLAPQPIVANRAPATNDIAELGTLWINSAADEAYTLTSVVAGAANWAITQAAGAVVTSLTVTGGSNNVTVDAGGTTTISSATIDFDAAAGTTTITNDLTVNGQTTLADVAFTGDIDITTADAFDITATGDQDPAILLRTNGGTNETLQLINSQGTAADAIEITSTAGGVEINSALLATIVSSRNNAQAILLNATAGGIDITAAGGTAEDIDITNTAGSIRLNSGEVVADSSVFISAGGMDFTVAGTGGLDIDMVNSAGSVNIEGGEAAGDAIVLHASDAAGGVQIQAGSGGILIGNQADCDTIDIGDVVPTSARTITIGGGAVATAIADTIDIGPDAVTGDAGASKVVTINNGVVDTGTLTTNVASGAVTSGTHTVNIQSGAVTAGTVAANLSTGTGTKTVNIGNADGLTTVNIDAITLINDDINVNTSINTGTSTGAVAIGNSAAGAISVDTAAGISLDAAAASNFTVAGAGIDLTLDSGAGRVIVNGEEAAANAVTLLSAAGGIDADAALQINIDSSQAAVADSVRIVASAADGGIDIDSGTGGLTLDSTGAVSVQGAAASDFSVSGAGIDLSLVSAAGRVIVNGEEAAANAVTLLSAAGGIDANAALQVNIDSSQAAVADSVRIVSSAADGGIDIDSGTGGLTLDSTGAFSIDGATASNVTVTGASQDLTLSAAGGSVNVTATEAAADAIVLNASNAAGGIDLLTGGGEISLSSSGNVSMVPGTATAGSPTANVTINARVGVATFTGFTTAAGANEDFTITNSALGQGDGVFVTVSNTGSNDADMSLEGVITETAGTLTIHTQNNGAAALNGSVVISFWIIN